jgi:hypothetical protein
MYICLIIFQEEVWEVGGQLVGLALGVLILVSALTVFTAGVSCTVEMSTMMTFSGLCCH